MSDGKLFTRSKSSELRAELEQAFKKSKPVSRVILVLKKVLANIIFNNHEVSCLMKDIIPLMKLDDLEVRKLCLEFLEAFAASNPDADDAIPYLSRFHSDPTPYLRVLALRTMSSINRKEFIELSVTSTTRLLSDSDPEVRKSAAYAVARIFQHDPARAEKENLVEQLNDLLYDSNPLVVSNALAALNSIIESSRNLNLTIDKNHAQTLINLLGSSNEWQQTYILNALMAYVPQTDDEALDLIESVLPALQHENSSVVMNAIKVVIYFCNYARNPELRLPVLPKRLGNSLVSLLAKPSETQFLVLRNVILLLLGRMDLVSFDVEMFYCRFDDPIYVKDTKLEIIYLLANESNVTLVLRELEEYATEVDVSMARKAIRAFGNLAVKLENASEQCVEVICDLVSNGISYIVQEAAIVIKNIVRKYPGKFEFAINELIKHYTLIDEPDAKTAFIWIVGQHCQSIKGSKKILEDFITSFKDDPAEVQYATLTAVTKYYLKFPEQGESIVLQVLKWATEEVDNPDIRDRGFIYWRLLSSENASGPNGEFQANTKKIVLNEKPVISSENDNINPAILEELELNIGTLASIYLKPVQTVFRLSKHKSLAYSPSLQRRSLLPTLHSNTNSRQNSRSLKENSPSVDVARRMSYRRTNSDGGSTRSSNKHPEERKALHTAPQQPPQKENLAKKFTKKASFFTNKIKN
ncbi:AP-1 complex subunit beta [Candida viswanathii]|uniref:AP complex subunit beta n=1 Tax=Candida viswanathii TaxID=5486 RepID=A0A367YD09_9ASCO|nr:AP-1 complex subunit beta [Candida viswanathii]